MGVAEAGRRRGRGVSVFPPSASLFAPAWLAERAVCSWLALGTRVVRGGIPYAGGVIRDAATPAWRLRRRFAERRAAPAGRRLVRHEPVEGLADRGCSHPDAPGRDLIHESQVVP